MERRLFLLISVAVAIAIPFDTEAQRAERHRLVGVVSSGYSAYWAKGGSLAHVRSAFEDGLQDAGYAVGPDVAIDFRFAEGDPAKLSVLTADLMTRSADVLVVAGPAALRVAQGRLPAYRSWRTISKVTLSRRGSRRAWARPGGNVTGAFLDQAEISSKWLELVREGVPGLARITAIRDAATPADQWRALQLSASVLRIQVQMIEVRGLPDFEGAFAAAARNGAQAVVLLSSPLISRHGRALADLATAKKLPTISLFKENATEGCLMSYGPSLVEIWRITGRIAGRVLKGSRASEIPIERPTRFELVINLKTAKALGLTIPPSLLLRADQVLE